MALTVASLEGVDVRVFVGAHFVSWLDERGNSLGGGAEGGVGGGGNGLELGDKLALSRQCRLGGDGLPSGNVVCRVAVPRSYVAGFLVGRAVRV